MTLFEGAKNDAKAKGDVQVEEDRIYGADSSADRYDVASIVSICSRGFEWRELYLP